MDERDDRGDGDVLGILLCLGANGVTDAAFEGLGVAGSVAGVRYEALVFSLRSQT